MGRRFVVNTDIINGLKRPISTVGFEAALSRNFSLELDYSFSENPVYAKYRNRFFTNWIRSASNETWNYYLPNYFRDSELKYNSDNLISSSYSISTITSKQKLWGGIMKIYSSSIFSAPNGRYYQFGFRAGKQSLSGHFNVPYYVYSSYYSSFIKSGERTINFKDVELNFVSLIFGRGRQFHIHPRVMLDVNYGASGNIIGVVNYSENSIFASLVSPKLGSNLIAFLNGADASDYSTEKIHSNMSLFLNVKLGILLF